MQQNQQMLLKNIKKVRDEALRSIVSQQQENGAFASNENNAAVYYTSLIVSVLNGVSETSMLQKKAVDFLLAERNDNWSFQYSDSYPADLDDTCIALRAIQLCCPEIVTGEALAHVTSLLVLSESMSGGPYETWIVFPRLEQWHDIDIVVNSNIAIFLSAYDIAMPQLQYYFENNIIKGDFKSVYYHDEIIVIYFLARAYAGNRKDMLIDALFKKQCHQGHWENPLFTALAVSTLLHLGVPAVTLSAAIEYLLESHANGKWPSQPFFIESICSGNVAYSSCDAHVSACCVEALASYENALLSASAEKLSSDADNFLDIVSGKCRDIFSRMSPLLQKQFQQSYAALMVKDPKREIPLLSYHFVNELACNAVIPEHVVADLAALNVLGWIGYGICDNVLDGESDAALLPMANVCIRAVSDIGCCLIKDDKEYSTIQRILDGIAISTAWEYEHCRITTPNCITEALPDYGSCACLAEKSLGHALGPIIICLLCKQYDQAYIIEKFFIHYLIARQLNDDAHDWLEDLQKGYINSVSTKLIEIWQKNNLQKQYRNEEARLWLRQYFWEHHIDIVSQDILSHCIVAREQLKKVTVLREVTFLEALLAPLEQSAREAISERNNARMFLNTVTQATAS